MNWCGRIRNHYDNVWGVKSQTCLFSAGPIHQLPEDFVVLKYAPHGARRMWTYATCGMSQAGDHRPIELHMFSPQESDDVVELLVVTAHFHRTGERLGLGHSVFFGRPWIGRSQCQYGLISLPYLDGPTLEIAHIDEGIVNFYWMIPVAHSEVEYKKKNGLESLEEKFDSTGFNYLDPDRKSVV